MVGRVGASSRDREWYGRGGHTVKGGYRGRTLPSHGSQGTTDAIRVVLKVCTVVGQSSQPHVTISRVMARRGEAR